MAKYGNDEENVNITSKLDDNEDLLLFYEGPIVPSICSYIAEELNHADQYKSVDLILSSEGGDTAYINCFPIFAKRFKIKSIVGIGQASSAALAIMLECKRHNIKVYVDKLCHIILHRVSATWVGEERYERIKQFNEKWVNEFETMFNKINIPLLKKIDKNLKKDYDKGHNIYLFGKDLIDLNIFEEFKQ